MLCRAGHTEATVDLARLAGLRACGVLAEVANDDGSMSRLPELLAFKERFGLKICTTQDLIAYRCKKEKLIERIESGELLTAHGRFTVHVYRNELDGRQHFALVKGVVDGETATLVRVQQGSLLDDLFTTATSAGTKLQDALSKVARAETGVLVYLVPTGAERLLKEEAADASQQPAHASGGTPLDKPMASSAADLRDYGLGAQILHDLGIRKLRLLTSQPRRIVALKGFGMELIDQVATG